MPWRLKKLEKKGDGGLEFYNNALLRKLKVEEKQYYPKLKLFDSHGTRETRQA